MIASLMMYARPELTSATERYWALIREALGARGIAAPERLTNEGDPWAVWQAPDLVLSQTCGMPYRTRLAGQVALLGTPDFGVPGCPPGYYRSVIVVRADDPREELPAFRTARFAFNERGSQSGYAAPYQATKEAGFWFEDRLQTGGHLHSARAVAEARADIAALDAVTWRLIHQYEGFAGGLRVLCETAPTPGLPYITALKAQREEIAGAVRAAIATLPEEDRAALGLQGLVQIPESTYLAIPNPPDGA